MEATEGVGGQATKEIPKGILPSKTFPVSGFLHEAF